MTSKVVRHGYEHGGLLQLSWRRLSSDQALVAGPHR